MKKLANTNQEAPKFLNDLFHGSERNVDKISKMKSSEKRPGSPVIDMTDEDSGSFVYARFWLKDRRTTQKLRVELRDIFKLLIFQNNLQISINRVTGRSNEQTRLNASILRRYISDD